jgi:hypothetical protein
MARQAVTAFLRQQRTADKNKNSEKGEKYSRSRRTEFCAEMPMYSIPYGGT